ncbi:MAG: glutamate synthase large subunit [Chloroflexi bacterium]|nr:glutamate synthase large subunit [Chloroflexota bacterium]
MKEIQTHKNEEPADQRNGRSLHRTIPQAQGLYDPRNEKDACGMGFVVNMKGRKSHEIVTQALTVLTNMSHRGASGCEVNTGDGAGIMLQIPDGFMRKVSADVGISLPDIGAYGVGMLFLSHDLDFRQQCQQLVEQIIHEEGQHCLGWRDVPTNNGMLGDTAIAGEPFAKQLFIQRNSDLDDSDVLAFERKLYVIRKRAEHEIGALNADEPFYFSSLSARTIVYKGMLTSEQVGQYYPDLSDEEMETAVALIHSRFSTNTFPSWERAHPYRYVIHNGEINTVKGNVNWMRARQSLLDSELFGDDLKKILPIIDMDGSDTAMFDNTLEFFTLAGRSLAHVMMMMIPEPWEKHTTMPADKRAFYQFHSSMMEAWDGPASIGFTDGTCVGAVLDRNGLRPSRYTVTKDDMVVLASETGALEIDPERVAYKGRLEPGRMLLVDTEQGRIISDEELKHGMAAERPYQQWLDEQMLTLDDLHVSKLNANSLEVDTLPPLVQQQQAFGYTFEDLRVIITPMAKDGKEALGSMGDDTPLAVLSEKPQHLFNYFKQLFAQVTNPPIDAIREELITSTAMILGSGSNILHPSAESCRHIHLDHPILTNEDLAKIRHIQKDGFKSATLPILFNSIDGGDGLERAMDTLFTQADEVIADGVNLLILSDRGIDRDHAGIPALLAMSGLHHHLIRQGTRTRVSLLIESGEVREVHHFATLIGFGADAINPYLAFATIQELIVKDLVTDLFYDDGVQRYVKAVVSGVIKIMSKMGISTIMSYCGAQIFEALGLHKSVIDKYFAGTPTRIAGSDIHTIAREVEMRHKYAFPERPSNGYALPTGGKYQFRENGEYHLFNPVTIHRLQTAVRTNNYDTYKKYADDVNDRSTQFATLRGLFKFKGDQEPIPVDEVESIESICRRFKSGAMSYGSISQEAHEALAIAMNRIGGRSNTGEGGEDPARFLPQDDGDSRNSATKQVASGRFGVTSQYLVNAKELQIKMAQGAKPGEGGHLPGKKVYPWIAKVRHSTPGVGLISPPPHHDIYSIEDLAQLIYDLKNANKEARINVKLVSEVGVGTIAAGVAKGHADVILISGSDGGTGASPQTSIKHAGLPWELGLAETHQTLMLNNLRSRVVVETDGQLKTGRDVVIAALLGAEEFGFATAPLVTLGCVMMRVCHKNTCPVGVATQNPELRKKFTGKPEHVVNFMHFVAQDMRKIMAALGFRTVDEMIGRTDKLETDDAVAHWKLKGIDLTSILYQPDVGDDVGRYCQEAQDHGLDETLDSTTLLDLCEPAIKHGELVRASLPIYNVNRTVGTMVGSEVTRQHGVDGLPDDTIKLHFKGSAGQSFGAFVPKGMTLELEGDANDYFGKGLSGGRLIVYPPKASTFAAEENIIIGNVALYGATGGEAFIRGVAGERFCVRNSGVTAVVEGVGDHGCEYMTGGKVVVLGKTGRNFAAGMSGGAAYVLDMHGDFHTRCNLDMVDLEPVEDGDEIDMLESLIFKHMMITHSDLAYKILNVWSNTAFKFVKVMPRDYKLMLEAFNYIRATTELTGDELAMAAFQLRQRQLMKI